MILIDTLRDIIYLQWG